MDKHKQQQKHTEDSITKVYIRLDEPKIVVSFRCNEKLWKAFKKQIRAQGLSICHVLEPMIFGWLNGHVNICNTIKPLKIENLIVERAVKRVRRYAVEEEVVGSDSEKYFCALDNEFVPKESLPLQNCLSCPNNACHKHVVNLANKEVVSNE